MIPLPLATILNQSLTPEILVATKICFSQFYNHCVYLESKAEREDYTHSQDEAFSNGQIFSGPKILQLKFIRGVNKPLLLQHNCFF